MSERITDLAQLEYRILYSMVVAGKSADFAKSALERYLDRHPQYGDETPFDIVRRHLRQGRLEWRLRAARTGNYNKLKRGFNELVFNGVDLESCTVLDLELIHGIGPKTSRFFLLWTRPDAQHAALDTHVLKWLGFLGHTTRRSTPGGIEYLDLERVMLNQAKQRGITARDLDAAIWDWCSSTKLAWGDHLRHEYWPPNLQPL